MPVDLHRLKMILDSDTRTLNARAAALGVSITYPGKLISAKNLAAEKPAMPSIAVLEAIEREYKVSLDWLLGRDTGLTVSPSGIADEIHRQSAKLLTAVTQATVKTMTDSGNRPIIEQVMLWWRSCGGRIGEAGHLADHFNLINIPDPNDRIVVPHTVGRSSLAAACLNDTDPAHLQHVVETMDPAKQRELVVTYHEASKREEISGMTYPHNAVVKSQKTGKSRNVEFFRWEAPGTAGDGKKYIISYCEEPQAISRDHE